MNRRSAADVRPGCRSPPRGFRFPLGTGPAGAGAAQEKAWRHGLSLFGDLKYPPGFKQFDYVNASAPKGGAVRQIAIGTFDNFNIVVAGVKGALATGDRLIYDTLLAPALDEVSTEYGLLAEAVSYPDDFSSATYRLRAEAKWHDGKPVTPEDVIFSFNAFKKYSPQLAAYYRHVVKVEKTGEREITFTFDWPGQSRTAADRRPAASSCPSIGGKAPTRTATSATSARPRSSRRSAAAPIASRISRPAATSSTSA